MDTSMYEPYEIAEVTMGKVNEVDGVWVVFMPRSDFLECVEDALHPNDDEEDNDYPESFKDEMRTTAQFMDVFAMNDWINEDRGCGCVVGEYLVAHDLLKREDVVSGDISVFEIMRNHPDYRNLERFGNMIDIEVGERFDREGIDAVVIID